MSLLARLGLVALMWIPLFPILVYGTIWAFLHGTYDGAFFLTVMLVIFVILAAGFLKGIRGAWLVGLALMLMGLLMLMLAVYGIASTILRLDPAWAATSPGLWVFLLLIGVVVVLLARARLQDDARSRR